MPVRTKHVPERTCVACRTAQPAQAKQPKRSLVRIVRSPEGAVSVDPTGKKAGRGAYLCADPTCWQAALAKGALERALHITITPNDRATLQAFADTLGQPGPAR